MSSQKRLNHGEKNLRRVSGTLVLRETTPYLPGSACPATYSDKELKTMMRRYFRHLYGGELLGHDYEE